MLKIRIRNFFVQNSNSFEEYFLIQLCSNSLAFLNLFQILNGVDKVIKGIIRDIIKKMRKLISLIITIP